jgi:hypothetical protein
MKPAIALVLLSTLAVARDKPDPRLSGVISIFVSGNNQAAEKARDTLAKDKCFVLATKAADADAVLDIGTTTNSMGLDRGSLGQFGAMNWIASGTLTLKSGDLVWSKSERFSDAPFRSGGKIAGKLLISDLARAADCKSRKGI